MSDINNQLSEYLDEIKYLIIKHGENHPSVADCYYKIGHVYSNKGEYVKALEYYFKSVDIKIINYGNNHTDVASCYNSIGCEYDSIEEYDKALEYYFKSLDIALLGNDHLDVAHCYNNIGNVYNTSYIANYDKALEYHFKSLDIRIVKFGNDHPDVATSYYNIGNVYTAKWENDKALEYYFKSLDIKTTKLGNTHHSLADTYNNIGDIYFDKSNYDKALEYYFKSLNIKITKYGNDHPDVARSYKNIGDLYIRKEEFNKAIYYYNKSVKISLKFNDFESIKNLHSISEYFTKNKNLQKANKLCYHCIRLLEKNPNNFKKMYIYSDDDYIKIYYYYIYINFELLLSKLPNSTIKSQSKKIDSGLTSTPSEEEEISKQVITRIVKYFKDNPNAEVDHQYNTVKSYFNDLKKIIAKAQDEVSPFVKTQIINILNENKIINTNNKNLLSAYETVEKIKAYGFLKRISIKSALLVEGISNQDNENILKLYDEIDVLNFRISKEIKKPELEIKNLLFDIKKKNKFEHEYDLLNKKLMINRKYKKLWEPKIATLEDAIGLCSKETAILEFIIREYNEKKPNLIEYLKYILLEESNENNFFFCMLIKTNGVKIFKIDFDLECSDFIKKLKPGGDNKIAFINKSFDLYSRLIAPLEEDLKGLKELIISPDGPLAFLPFDILRKDKDSPYLCEQFTLSLVPSISVMKMIKDRNYDVTRHSFLGFGDVRYSDKDENGQDRCNDEQPEITENFIEYHAGRFQKYGLESYRDAVNEFLPNLPWTGEEIREIAWNVFDNDKSKIYVGDDASEKKIKELSKNKELSNYKFIHFACHGRFDEYLPQNSSVILSEYIQNKNNQNEDGYLDVNDVAILNLNADLVTLSACRTGLGKIIRGDGIVGLTRAFQVAGANNVLSTIWKIEDKSTKDFMVTFYNKIHKEKLPIKKALQETKLEYIKNGKEPFYWAGFVLWGA